MDQSIFKAYDIRGIFPSEINADDVKKIAMAYASWLKPRKVALGRDVRLSGPELWQAAADGLTAMGVDVVDIGVISTDMLYFAVANYSLDGGITISASHNAVEYNGMKLVREESRPISTDTGILEIKELATKGEFSFTGEPGSVEVLNIHKDYLAKMLSLVDVSQIKPMKVLVNPNFGASGSIIQEIAQKLSLDLVKLNFDPDGHFPKGKPDPMQAAIRQETVDTIKANDVAFGATWDADADRCFIFDEKGEFILPYHITGLLMDYFIKEGAKRFVIDPRLTWLPFSLAKKAGAEVFVNKAGHSFIKERMRAEDAYFGAETSAHYYFKELWYTDNGMIPFLVLLEILSKDSRPLSEIVREYRESFYAIEETNFKVQSVPETIQKVRSKYSTGKMSEVDGVSIEFPEWQMNLRGSNTEPVIRLNIEAKTKKLAQQRLTEITKIIQE